VQRSISCAAAGLAAALVLAAPAGAADWTAGAPTANDPFFGDIGMGNGGYDVRHYALDLDYDPATKVLDATARITLVPTQDLDQFNLDLRTKKPNDAEGLTVSRVAVGKHRAAWFTEGVQELVVTPRPKLHTGRSYTVEVDYAGVPATVIDPDHSSEGWVKTPDGAIVVNEPQGSPGWFPANDDPNDKATYDFAITVPAGNVALGNGRLLSSVTEGGKTTWRWREDSPMATYLTTATNGKFDLSTDTAPGGQPIYNAVDSGFSQASKDLATQRFAGQPAMLAFLEGIYGPYPFTSAGAIVDNAAFLGYALESQTKPNYSRVSGQSTFLHELAHQWVGNSVTLSVWPDIWLNEGFATWSEWRWTEHNGGDTAQETFQETYDDIPADDEFWEIPTADPGEPANLFLGPAYDRGAMTLQALREKVGENVFSRILRAWYAENRNGNVTTADFIALAERESGQQLDAFFDVWLFQPEKPTSW
jgi:aminopeptidase N